MSYIKDLVRGYNSCEVRTCHILLVWQLDSEGTSLLDIPWSLLKILRPSGLGEILDGHRIHMPPLSNLVNITKNKYFKILVTAIYVLKKMNLWTV